MAKKIAAQISDKNYFESDQRLEQVRKTNGTLDEEFQKMELVRSSIREVKKNAIANEIARMSPRKLYSGVKSKVASNLKI